MRPTTNATARLAAQNAIEIVRRFARSQGVREREEIASFLRDIEGSVRTGYVQGAVFALGILVGRYSDIRFTMDDASSDESVPIQAAIISLVAAMTALWEKGEGRYAKKGLRLATTTLAAGLNVPGAA
jgi:hypothetical protein